MQVEHELAERPLQPGELAFQHHEARAGHARGGLEIHQARSLADLEMLLARGELRPVGLELAILDVAVLVGALGHVRVRAVRDRGEAFVEDLGGFCLSRVQRRRLVLQARDLGHQTLRPGLVLRLLGAADLLGEGIAALLVGLGRRDRGFARVVQGDELGRERRQPAPAQGVVEGVRILADGADVVHGSARREASPTLCRIGTGPTRSGRETPRYCARIWRSAALSSARP